MLARLCVSLLLGGSRVGAHTHRKDQTTAIHLRSVSDSNYDSENDDIDKDAAVAAAEYDSVLYGLVPLRSGPNQRQNQHSVERKDQQ